MQTLQGPTRHQFVASDDTRMAEQYPEAKREEFSGEKIMIFLETNLRQHPAATGEEFSDEKIRTFLESDLRVQLKFKTDDYFEENESERNAKTMCEKWGVLTNISVPTEAVRRFPYKPYWCVVVVGDLDKPKVSLDTLSVNVINST